MHIWMRGSKGRSGSDGAMRLSTVRRRTGLERSVMVGYFEDGPNLVTMAMNGWGEGEPAWWLSLRADLDVRIDMGSSSADRVWRAAHAVASLGNFETVGSHAPWGAVNYQA